MEQKTKTWHSSKLNRKMEIISYGWFGKPVLLFPSDDVHEYERFSMIEALKDLLDVGKIKCYLVGTLHKETWENSELPREKCGQLQNQYNDYITEEVIPYIREDCKSESLRIVSAGTGLGAFQSCTQVFRRPNLFDTLIAISGTYDLKPFLHGYTDTSCYLNSPIDFIPNLEDEFYLSVLRNQCSLNFLVGQGAYENPKASKEFCEVLKKKGIPHNLDLWGTNVNHDWIWWKKMLPYYCNILIK